MIAAIRARKKRKNKKDKESQRLRSEIKRLRIQIGALHARLTDELYPTLRWFLYDGLERYASPVTIFGPLRAALYLGQMYLVLTSSAHVQRLSRHFDELIRGAVIQPPDVPDFVRRLRDEVVLSRR